MQEAIMRLGYVAGHDVSNQRAQVLAGAVLRAGWTAAELELAEALILTDPELTKQISYERTVGPGVFALAKERFEVKAGRLWPRREALRMAHRAQVKLSDAFEAVWIEGEDGEEEALFRITDPGALYEPEIIE